MGGVRVWDTNMLVSKNAKICVTPNANAKFCVTPNANSQPPTRAGRIYAKFLHWPCRFHVVCASFSTLATRKLAKANTDSGGIQAYGVTAQYLLCRQVLSLHGALYRCGTVYS